jgi:hypothetical protein
MKEGAAGGRAVVGLLLQIVGLALLPAAVFYGLKHDDIWSELVIATMGIALLIMGRNMRTDQK